MDDDIWAAGLRELTEAANMLTILANCLAVTPQLGVWRERREELAGMNAANALGQPRGDLERLAAGGAAALLSRVDALLVELPTPWE